jgi:hypothetical protein
MAERAPLPAWAERIRRTYIGGESSMFLLHLNVFDQILYENKSYSLNDFLARVLLWENKQNIILYDPAAGVSFLKATEGLRSVEELRVHRSATKLLPLLEAVLFSTDSTALIVPYAGTLAPEGDQQFLSDQDRMSLVTFHRWSLSRELGAKDNVVFLLTEMLSEVHSKLVSNPTIGVVEVPLPDQEERAAVVRRADSSLDERQVELLAKNTAGLRAVQITALLTPKQREDLGKKSRFGFIRRLLGESADAEQRAEKLASLTGGMDLEQIRHLINPSLPSPGVEETDTRAEVMELVHRRKREIIEKECAGLIEFIDARHDLSVVGGIEGVKEELRAIARNITAGDRVRVPMGLLFVGPMGSGKTFVANAFIKESGLSAVRLKNFRSKWVGSTESNLEKVLGMVRSLGPIILVIDEGDRAFGGEESDGGTSSRVIARIKEFMSDPDNRGKVIFIVMTNRPDKLDVDMKRAGRLDRKIPFFYPDQPELVESVVDALFRRYQVKTDLDWARDREATSARLVGYSNADLEAVCLLANDLASEAGSCVGASFLAAAAADYMPAKDAEMLEYMELLAVFETSRRSMLPLRYRDLSTDELNDRLRVMRAKIRR